MQGAVDLLADAALLSVEYVVDGGAVGPFHVAEVAQWVIRIGRGGASGDLGSSVLLTARGVGELDVAVVQAAVLVVVGGNRESVDMGAVAVGIVGVGGDQDAVLMRGVQATGRGVCVVVDGGFASQGLYFSGDAIAGIRGELDAINVRAVGGDSVVCGEPKG